MDASSLKPASRKPSAGKIIQVYLKSQEMGCPWPDNRILTIDDAYTKNPDEIQQEIDCKVSRRDFIENEWYFYTTRKTDARHIHSFAGSYLEETDERVMCYNELVGYKTIMSWLVIRGSIMRFYNLHNRAPGTKTWWIIHEYRSVQPHMPTLLRPRYQGQIFVMCKLVRTQEPYGESSHGTSSGGRKI